MTHDTHRSFRLPVAHQDFRCLLHIAGTLFALGIIQADDQVALTGAVYHDVSKALYSAVPLYVSSVVMDGIIYGLDYSTVALIISERFEDIIQAIEEKLDRGVTILEGRGGYSGEKKQVLLCAIRRRQAPQLKSIVREIDPEAFVILQEAHQVLGEGFRRNGDEM